MEPLIVTADNAADQIELARCRAGLAPGQRYRGCLRRTTRYGRQPGFIKAANVFPRIPREQWKDLIIEGKGTFLGDLTRPVLAPHDQGDTNYCWAHGCVRAVEALRVYEGQAPMILSAESIAVPITSGRNRAGTAAEALRQLADQGACKQSLWPLNERDVRLADPRWMLERQNHVVLNWMDLEDFDDQITLALHRIPVPIGLDWWGHEVCQLDPVILPDGSVGIGCDNSWGADYGDNGYFLLDEAHGTSDLGAFAPISETWGLT